MTCFNFTNLFSLTFGIFSLIQRLLDARMRLWYLNCAATNSLSSSIACDVFAQFMMMCLWWHLMTLPLVVITLLVSIYCCLLAITAVEMKNHEELLEDIRDEASTKLLPEKGEYKIWNSSKMSGHKTLAANCSE